MTALTLSQTYAFGTGSSRQPAALTNLKRIIAMAVLAGALWAGLQALPWIAAVVDEQHPGINSQSVDLSNLPAGVSVPVVLPRKITDPRLLEGWIRLYNNYEAVELEDGSMLTGHDVAQFLLEHAIPVQFDTDNACGQSSCSVLYCRGNECTYNDGQPGTDPLYVHPNKANDMHALMTTMVHETFHRMRRFGNVEITQYEEYWAFRVSLLLTHDVALHFEGYNMLNANDMNRWFSESKLTYYLALSAYPPSMLDKVQGAAN